jgi:hypothetical protein
MNYTKIAPTQPKPQVGSNQMSLAQSKMKSKTTRALSATRKRAAIRAKINETHALNR